mmetsp:Transcript_3240/g.4916  ORF Transcript_3240/g.4916 Transcript_3240/m.4916 type:complete len:172 (-) Transcript_3240:207-722(-)
MKLSAHAPLLLLSVFVSNCAAFLSGYEANKFYATGIIEGGVDRPLVDTAEVILDIGQSGAITLSGMCAGAMTGTCTTEEGLLKCQEPSLQSSGCAGTGALADEDLDAQEQFVVLVLKSSPEVVAVECDGKMAFDISLNDGDTSISFVVAGESCPEPENDPDEFDEFASSSI